MARLFMYPDTVCIKEMNFPCGNGTTFFVYPGQKWMKITSSVTLNVSQVSKIFTTKGPLHMEISKRTASKITDQRTEPVKPYDQLDWTIIGSNDEKSSAYNEDRDLPKYNKELRENIVQLRSSGKISKPPERY